MRLPDAARIAIVGAGPAGIVAARYALEAGFEPTVFEAGDRLGGQWDLAGPHSGVWPGMHTNTSRELTAFSDFPPPAEYPLHPTAEQIRDYLEAYADAFGVIDRIRFGSQVRVARPDGTVDGERFDALVVASGRFRSPRLPSVVAGFRGELLHAFDYPGAGPFADRIVLVYGNGVSGVEVASDLAPGAEVISAFRRSRYVIQKVVDGVSSDWQWYTLADALDRRLLPAEEWARRRRDRILQVAGDPADFGAPPPDEDLRVAGVSLGQDYLRQIRAGDILCRPAIASVDGRTVDFTDGSTATVDAIVCATGYTPDVPYLREAMGEDAWVDTALFQRTFHPDHPRLGVIGQFLLQGPYWPLLELQARWIVAVWSGAVSAPGERRMREAIATPRPYLESHDTLALLLSEELGVAPDPAEWPELAEPLLLGPMLPARYRLRGPGARASAAGDFKRALTTAPRPASLYADLEVLRKIGQDTAASRLRDP
jgi:NADPH-dependent 2,4-dienoyl-CoA reductase/sulfur reductase-like enzyme